MRMTFTLITITLNAQERLPRCIKSVLEQTTPPDEYVFVDGGSTDGTLGIIDEAIPRLAEKGIEARLLRQVHKTGSAGIPEAWNQGIASAHGDVIALLNSDDFYAPNAIEKVVAAFSDYPSAELISSPIAMVDSDGRKLYSLYPHCLCLCEIKMPLPHPGTFVRKSLYEKIGLYDERYAISADYDFIWRCRKTNAKIRLLENTLVNMEAGGLANSSRKAARRETLDIALKHSSIPLIARIAFLLRTVTGR